MADLELDRRFTVRMATLAGSTFAQSTLYKPARRLLKAFRISISA